MSNSPISNFNGFNVPAQLHYVPGIQSASFAASREGHLMIMLFLQELDLKMTQNMQEAERRSNATLMQTMAFIANNN